MSDLISIIVPVYNLRDYLDRCVNSIVRQTYSNLEILLIDDGSTDGSGQLAEAWRQRDDRIAVYHKVTSKNSNHPLEKLPKYSKI